MVWYFNFCAPTLPNDPTINFHRHFQTGCLMGLLIIYVVVHIYYKICKSEMVIEKTAEEHQQSRFFWLFRS
jgi:hypothetical protein